MKRYIQKFEAKQTSEVRQLARVSNLPQFMALMLILSLLVAFNIAWAATPAKISPADAAAVLADEKFDHVKTGFNLTGAHATARCVTCHINNVLKGTPRECASCHIAGNRMNATAKPNSNHLITNEPCGTCHKTSLWSPAFFSHVGIAPGTCKTCHNGSQASGLPRGHTSTNSSCDSCHKTTDWLQAAFSHKGIINGCSTCHGQTFQGATPTDKPSNHMVTSADCSECHITTSFVTLKAGANIPLPAGHFPTTQQCGLCHNGASFVPGIMNHLGITANCETCHNGQIFLGLAQPPKRKVDAPSTHMTTSLPCATCHTSTSTFTISAGAVLPMPAGHMPSQQPCSICHASYGPGSGVMSHTGIAVGCASCHGGQNFSLGGVSPTTKSGSHIPTSNACEVCHSSTRTNTGDFANNWTRPMPHTGITGNCASCHDDGLSFGNATPGQKQDVVGGHMPTTADCSVCHTSTITFQGATGGVLPANHIPSTQPCSLCHTSGFGSGSGLPMDHLGIVSNCSLCHSDGMSFLGTTPKRKQDASATHLTTSEDCSSCHTSTITFFGASTNSKPANHLPTNLACNQCHAAGYGPGDAIMLHTGIVNNCSQCHNGQTFAVGMTPVNKSNFPPHVQTPLDCSSCHYPSPNNFSSFAGATGGAMPINHIPTSQSCTLCHTGTPGVTPANMNHAGILNGCITCHNGQTFAGVAPEHKASNHVPTNRACETCHSSTVFSSFAGTSMNHVGIVNGCAGCHSGSAFQGTTPLAKPSNHVPTNRVTNGNACETCHSASNFNTFSGAPMRHTGIANNCVECHGKAGAPKPYIGPPRYEPNNHIPYTANLLGGGSMGCEFCHKSTSSFTLGVSSTAMHNGSQGNPGSGYCAGCHLSGTNWLGVRGRKSLNHEAGGTQIDCSKSGCHRPRGNEGSTYNSW